MKDWIKLSLAPKLVEKLVWVPVILCTIMPKLAVFKENERLDKTQFSTKIGGKTSLGPSHFVHYYAETGPFQGK